MDRLLKFIREIFEVISAFITSATLGLLFTFFFALPVLGLIGYKAEFYYWLVATGLFTGLIFVAVLFIKCDRGIWLTQINREDIKYFLNELKMRS